jgi:hypothetical protein
MMHSIGMRTATLAIVKSETKKSTNRLDYMTALHYHNQVWFFLFKLLSEGYPSTSENCTPIYTIFW